jgi:hypothetical protein
MAKQIRIGLFFDPNDWAATIHLSGSFMGTNLCPVCELGFRKWGNEL